MEQLTQGTIVANLGFSEVRFPAPMYAGDTLRAETRVLSKRLSNSRPGEGVVTLEHTGRNQDGDRGRRRRPRRHGPVPTRRTQMHLVIEPFPGPALLFCPADRPDRYAKAAAAADVVILDLEDGVALADKAAARRHLVETPLDPERTIVRINPAGTTEHHLDLAALDHTAYRMFMLAKAEQAIDIRDLAARLPAARVIALCETALGVLNAAELAADPATVALMWGAEDLIVSLGGRSSRHPDGDYRDVAVRPGVRSC